MATTALASYGSQKWKYSPGNQASGAAGGICKNLEWIHQRYTPLDLRHTAPVPRSKIVESFNVLPSAPPHWVPPASTDDPKYHSRENPGKIVYHSQPSTRCEEWSTLRQILPSKDNSHKVEPPSWGSGESFPPIFERKVPRRFPMVNSPMSRFTSDMTLTNREFRLH